MPHLDGKVALVTGAGSGIGRGTAERLAREGANVCVADIDIAGAEETASMVREFGREAIVVRMNVASKQQVQDGAAECVKELGRLDVAVANAGIARAGLLVDMDLKQWQDQVDVNLTGVFLTAQAAAQRMIKLGNGGRIVCISSLAAETTGQMMWGYSATKAGVRIMVRGWAQELGPHGITVNAIGPGVIDTPLAHGLAGDEGGPIRKGLEAATPIGRVGTPKDIAGLVNFLCSPDGEFFSGAYLIMDGGIRDARALGRNMENADSEIVAEATKHFTASMERNERLQPLIDQR